jgi:two-component system, NarL family, nitrate/nitrite response regulator NarL
VRAGTPVLIVDDHPVFRQGLAAVLRLRGFDNVHAVSGTESVEELARYGGTEPWAAILDVRLTHTDGVKLCRALKAIANPPVTIMLSTFTEPAIVQASREAGAYAYLSKEADPDEIVRLLRRGLEHGGTVIPARKLPILTDRERAVLRCLANGSSNRAISDELGIGVETVKDHLQRLFDKLEVSDRLNAVRRAKELGVLDV